MKSIVKLILMNVFVMFIVTCLSGFKPKVCNTIPLDKNQNLSWHKKEIIAKRFYFTALKNDHVSVVVYDIENNSRRQIMDTCLNAGEKITIKYPVVNKLNSNDFFLAIRINTNYYFKHIEIY